MTTTEDQIRERVAALEAKGEANDKAAERALQTGEKALERSEAILVRVQDQSRQYVTRSEFQWAIGAVVLVLVGLLVRMLIPR